MAARCRRTMALRVTTVESRKKAAPPKNKPSCLRVRAEALTGAGRSAAVDAGDIIGNDGTPTVGDAAKLAEDAIPGAGKRPSDRSEDGTQLSQLQSIVGGEWLFSSVEGEKKSRTVRCSGGNTTQPANLAAMQGLIGSLAGGAMTGGQVDRLVGLRE